ncbi:MAG: TerB family tellurite resistance protein [Pseudomonadales bacterium]|jgi:uncharacterized tellurite resistance protein B-like protein|nr:TerB family tellurite resistance protein [Pseudomonadales bacterium]MDP6471756.1 TerB family tellurite resistance protein [Pseudomonadales bacterium]MDP6971412.1 TerB family tellurite resistance protein [Pseudomonadales bacterium]|tara:strand:+ start:2662 stop:3102 length:441 start_codon:yes stop_codon:yes gene_type:complete
MLKKLLERLKESEPEREENLVALAAATLFLEVAWADHDLQEEELTVARNALKFVLGIDDAEVDILMDHSLERLDAAVGMQAFTRELVNAWSLEQRFALLVQLWKLALADQQIDRYEEATIRKIAELLYVPHARFIEARRIARDESG